jgi:predicted permease
MTTLWQDLRYAVRMLRKSPGFTAIALITLAIGIGANTIMFSVADLLVLRPVKVRKPEQLVCCGIRNFGSIPYSAYLTIRDGNPVFTDLMAQDEGMGHVTLTYEDVTMQAAAMFVSANYFSFLGVAPARGRGFLPEEEGQDASPVVVLSYRAWQRQGADPQIVGKYITINGARCQVVGIAPEGFTGAALIGPDLWLPPGSYLPVVRLYRGLSRPSGATDDWWNYSEFRALVGRLKPGLSMSAAQAALQALAPRLEADYPRRWQRDCSLYLYPSPRLATGAGDNERLMVAITSLVLMGVSATILIIACLNLANMLIVQGAGRHREITIRLALGSGRLRIIRQLLIESLLLALLGGVLGFLLAFWGTRVLNVWIAAAQVPELRSLRTGLNVRILAATLGFCLIAAMLFGLRPALCLSRRDLVGEMKESGGAVLGPVRRRRGGLSVLCQIALAVVLVMGATLFTRSALRLSRPDPRFNLDDKLVIQVDPLAAGYDRIRSAQVCEALADYLASLPGVEALGMSPRFSFGGGGPFSIYECVPGQESDGSRRQLAPSAAVSDVGRDYFAALGIPLLQGRPFDRLDSAPDAEKVMIIDETLARKLRPDGNALGCFIQWGFFTEYSEPCRVVGIVPNVRDTEVKEIRAQAYKPAKPDQLCPYIYLHIADTGSAAVLTQRISEEIHKVDSRVPVLSVATLTQRHRDDPSVWLAGFGARLALAAGAAALFLAALGIYAIKGYMVASRTSEIGIRKALGATHKDIMGMVFREGLILTVVGLILGLLLGLGVAKVAASMLYVSPVDPVSIVATMALLGAASLLAGYIPARRAAKVDPMVALRYE